ncbi:MAG: hypothetical protein ACOVKL_06765 [Polynucleobacter sp.]
MNTYTAMVAAQVGNTSRLIKTQIRAASAGEAKWLLQAIYGFHALASFPTQEREVLTTEDSTHPATPEQQRIASLKTAKDRAGDALKAERDRQKKQNAIKTLRTLPVSPSS